MVRRRTGRAIARPDPQDQARNRDDPPEGAHGTPVPAECQPGRSKAGFPPGTEAQLLQELAPSNSHCVPTESGFSPVAKGSAPGGGSPPGNSHCAPTEAAVVDERREGIDVLVLWEGGTWIVGSPTFSAGQYRAGAGPNHTPTSASQGMTPPAGR
jgi:hypothetical protein